MLKQGHTSLIYKPCKLKSASNQSRKNKYFKIDVKLPLSNEFFVSKCKGVNHSESNYFQ